MSHLAGISVLWLFLRGMTSWLSMTSCVRACVCVYITVSPALSTSPPPDLPPPVHHSLYQCPNRVSSFQKPSPPAGLPVGAGEPGYRWPLKYLVRANRVRLLLLSSHKGQEIDPGVTNFAEVQYLPRTCQSWAQKMNWLPEQRRMQLSGNVSNADWFKLEKCF